ncbi:MAG: hypothetical protein AVDCRST_MAG27-1285, partial [uncultured Craurococcus sp.]
SVDRVRRAARRDADAGLGRLAPRHRFLVGRPARRRGGGRFRSRDRL